MIAPSRYLLWARRYFGKIPYDLATSGLARPTRDELDLTRDRALDEITGYDRLRAAIARFNAVPEGEASATLGTSHGLFGAFAALTTAGDDVLVEAPTYEPMWRVPEGLGLRVVRVDRPAREGFAIDPVRVEKAMTVRTRVVAVTNLHNPTGVRIPDQTLRELALLCERRGAHLLVDEVYAPFDAIEETSPGTRERLKDGVWSGSARAVAPNIVTTGSLTKCFGLGLERIGWILGPADIIERADSVTTLMCGQLPVQHANIGVSAFQAIDKLAARARLLTLGKRARVDAWIATRPDLSWSAPCSGLFGFATSSRSGDLTPTLEAGAKSHGVLASAGSFFGVPNGIRLSWAISGEKLDEALSRLGDVLPKSNC